MMGGVLGIMGGSFGNSRVVLRLAYLFECPEFLYSVRVAMKVLGTRRAGPWPPPLSFPGARLRIVTVLQDIGFGLSMPNPTEPKPKKLCDA
uniref:Uncharacterized protein n=1 Tax=Candidatus Kentrum sp. FW TaxID=2126338 RepID=A0A450TX28_9GAMM|nr:MAG: hypothetical protein BECKFW1821C_GA0114237_105423 [Candidatus Kentron sp. FW]